MTSGADGVESGDGRHRWRFSEHAKSVAAILTGLAALLIAVAGMITLLCSDPEGDPASAVTTTATATRPQRPPAAGGSGISSPAPRPSPTQVRTPTPAPLPQWQGDVQVNPLGYSLATIPPSPDQSGDPDISAAFDGTFFANLGAARWTEASAPSPQACATLIGAQNVRHMTAVPGDTYCIRVAHTAANPGNQYAAVLIVRQGRDATDFPYVRIHATVWPDQ
ncbi:hypothetical protein Caci_8139 [Catenulispora acidiphila DSM 44928]|uniref:Uncharacterized protein n=1 Tax=Catenulispora acidiphila (strain DSM 44928 / JCM 14897 / NBRC 102108 / NRRL B-24433 / ID139908) TaxID=479433 RepID=C7QIR2_CATAD|nr:hypothetical protein Caci_8139 [Catenulispora acidiphila DSM 44928]